MLESALGIDLERFGEYQTRLVKLDPKLGSQLGEGAAPAAPAPSSTPAPAGPATGPSGIPPVDHTGASTPGAHTYLFFLCHLHKPVVNLDKTATSTCLLLSLPALSISIGLVNRVNQFLD